MLFSVLGASIVFLVFSHCMQLQKPYLLSIIVGLMVGLSHCVTSSKSTTNGLGNILRPPDATVSPQNVLTSLPDF